MKGIFLSVIIFVGLSCWVNAQVVTLPHQQTTPPPNARYEIVQSQLAARWTFRLDRFSGRVAMLVKKNDDNNTWVDMEVIDLPAIPTLSRPRFQIFTSGLAARHTFLLDTATGQTWLLVSVSRKSPGGIEYEDNVWQPFAK
jgi:hypothetical protein